MGLEFWTKVAYSFGNIAIAGALILLICVTRRHIPKVNLLTKKCSPPSLFSDLHHVQHGDWHPGKHWHRGNVHVHHLGLGDYTQHLVWERRQSQGGNQFKFSPNSCLCHYWKLSKTCSKNSYYNPMDDIHGCELKTALQMGEQSKHFTPPWYE